MIAAHPALLLVHLAATLFMAGLIWCVQVVHYPLMARVGADRWVEYEASHQRRITLVVGPVMLLEAATAIALLWVADERTLGIAVVGALWAAAALLAALWCSTFLLQVPLHAALSKSFDPNVHRRLVASNWIRTACWSLRALLVTAVAAM